MNKKYLFGIGAVVVVLLIVILGRGGKQTLPTENHVLKVGVIAPLTGFLSEFGDAVRNGMMLAEKEATPNTKIEFVFEDSAYDPKKAISAYTKLATIDKADVIVNWGDATTQAVAPLVKNYSDISFVALSSLTTVPAQDPKIVRMWERPENFAAKTWEHLRSLGLKKIAVLKVQNQYVNTLFDQLKAQVRPGEVVDLVDDVTSFDQKDFRTTITKLKTGAVKYDAIGVYLASGQIGQFYKQMGEQGFKKQTFGTDFFESQSDIDVAGKLMDGAFYAHYEVSPEFKTRYNNTYGNLSQVAYAGNAYDVARMLIEQKGLTNGKSVLDFLTTLNGYSGILGNYTYKTSSSDSDRYVTVPIHIKEIRDSKIQTIQ